MAPAHAATRFYAAERYLTKLVESAPPLSDAQRAHLAAILVPAADSTGTAA